METSKKIVALLNSQEFSNMRNEDQVELEELMNEYFTADSKTDDGWSDSESDDEQNSAHGTGSTADEDIEDEKEGPVLKIRGGKEFRDSDVAENMREQCDLLTRAEEFSCGCKQIKCAGSDDPRSGCIKQFSPQEIVAMQMSVKDMDRGALDMHVVSILSIGLRNGELTECTKRKSQKERTKSRTTFCLMGRTVCRKAFLFLMDNMNRKRLDRLGKHFKTLGMVQPTLKSGGRKNNTACLTLDVVQRVVDFIQNFAEAHAVSLPGRVPGFKREDIRLLPSAFVKSVIYRRYKEAAAEAEIRAVGASTFRKLWLQCCPFIVVARPMTDLCWRCQKNTTNIFHSKGLSHEEKWEIAQAHQSHLSQVDAEREHYRNQVAAAKAVVGQLGVQRLERNIPNSRDCEMHYSFDFAQQVHYPSNAAQPGPMYFMTARKCGVFGVCCEGLPQQVNYLIDEGMNCSKGSNAVISYLHHFFENYGLGERAVHLHCDNCAGQNKNKYVLWYFCWRVQRGLHTDVTINFMPPGHTKFAPDWCFGLFKRRFRRSEVSCLDDICRAVVESTPVSGVNIPQLVGKEDSTTVFVETYDWQSFFSPVYTALPGIKNLSHFRFSANDPGRMFYRSSLAEEEQHKDLTTAAKFLRLGDMPHQMPVPGLPLERRQYLYQHIREFVRCDVRDIVCPQP